jgi:hypothetical protein
MNSQDRLHLLAKRKFLQERLAELPASARITRISTESRLRVVDERLAQAPVDERDPARAPAILILAISPILGYAGAGSIWGMNVSPACGSRTGTT